MTQCDFYPVPSKNHNSIISRRLVYVTTSLLVAERLSAGLLIVQVAFVYVYIILYIRHTLIVRGQLGTRGYMYTVTWAHAQSHLV